MQAILITAYKNYGHLKDIVDFFNDEYSIYIHIDKKSILTKEQIEEFRNSENVKYIVQKYNVNWGGINHLLAILDLMEEAQKKSDNDFFHLITGHDYPIKSLDEFRKFHYEHKNHIFMEHHPLPYYAWGSGGLDRLEQYNLYDLINGKKGDGENLNKKIIKLQKIFGIKRSFYNGFPQLYGGSTYWSMSREAINLIFNYIDNKPEYLKRFRYSFCSEEIFFQTILLNSQLKDRIINNNLRFIVWEMRNGNFPANLDESDLNGINCSDALFARKFEFPTSKILLAKIKNE